jgi:hydroxymethylpyrimidine/phosphomethylpyrimidine kinase
LIDIKFLIKKTLPFQKLLFPNREEIEKLEMISAAEVNQIESQRCMKNKMGIMKV